MTPKALGEIRSDACNIIACLADVVKACEVAHEQAMDAARNRALKLPAYLLADESLAALRDADAAGSMLEDHVARLMAKISDAQKHANPEVKR